MKRRPHLLRIGALSLLLLAGIVGGVQWFQRDTKARSSAPAVVVSSHSTTMHENNAMSAATTDNIPQPTPSTADDDQKIVDIFGIRTWEPPKPAVPETKPVAMASPPPQAPPLPFRCFGKIDDPDRGMTFMLARGPDVLTVGVGDTIDNTYRVDKFEHGQLIFLYQPLDIRQSLSVGSDL